MKQLLLVLAASVALMAQQGPGPNQGPGPGNNPDCPNGGTPKRDGTGPGAGRGQCDGTHDGSGQCPRGHGNGQGNGQRNGQGHRGNRPPNLHLIDGSATPEFQPDGVHLTAYSGLRFVVHLFDAAISRIEAPPSSVEADRTQEAIRVVSDRVGVLEQGQARISVELALKTAVDAELDEFQENVRFEDHFLISGLPGPESGLSTRDWQGQVKSQIQEKIQLLLGRQAPIA